jgi:hypothetical protein
MGIKNQSCQVLNQLKNSIEQLSEIEYKNPLPILNQSSIGMHVRHILEFYSCLFKGLELGVVNYDNRERNLDLQEKKAKAIDTINMIIQTIGTLDESNSVDLEYCCDSDDCNQGVICIKTNVGRELLYNLEHTIHHKAIIKIAFVTIQKKELLPPNYGVAPSTIRHQEQVQSN